MSLKDLSGAISDYLAKAELKNVEDEHGNRWLQITSHKRNVIPAINYKPHWLDIRLKAPPNTEFYEAPITLLISYLIEHFRPSVFFDVGARTGHFSLLAASHERYAPTVHAFEVNPDPLQILQQRSKRPLPGQIFIHLSGLSDRDQGTRRVWYSRNQMFEHEPAPREYQEPWYLRLKFALQGKTRARALYTAEVLLTSIDAFCAQNAVVPGLIKIDVDGYEGKVLQGAHAVLRRDQPIVLLELHKDSMQRFGLKRQDVVDMLFDAGYRALFITDHHETARTKLKPVERNDPLFRRAETDMILFIPPRCLTEGDGSK